MAVAMAYLVAVATCALLGGASAHSYHLGSCPQVEGMPEFQMNKFLGVWYIIQKTSTASSCLANNYTVDHETGAYTIEQMSKNPILGLTRVDHIYRYTGRLSVPRPNSPARMVANFPLSVAGSAAYTVFTTDYENYAGVFTCQKMAFAHRQSASILSRTRTLDKQYLDKIRNKLSNYGIDPFDLSIIDQSDCPTDGYDININPDTFSVQNIAGLVRKGGEKLGDGLESVASGAKAVYHTVRGNSRDREELSITQNHDQTEWLP